MLKVVTIDEAKRALAVHFGDLRLETEELPVHKARGRFLARPVVSKAPVPHFRRSTKDGYAVKAAEVAGAGDALPALFSLLPDGEMGKAYAGVLKSGRRPMFPPGGWFPTVPMRW